MRPRADTIRRDAMIPIRDDIPSRRFPFVTYAIIAANVLVFWYELRLGRELDAFVKAFGLVPARFYASHDPGLRLLPVFTSMFLHGGLLHLAGNMLYLHIFGDNVEDRLGHGVYLLFYFFCGVAAAMAQVSLFPHSRMPMVGASGAIAGVTGAYFVFYPRARVLTLIPFFFFYQMIQVPAVVFLLLWFVMQLAYGAASLGMHGADVGGVAFWAHVGGFVSGMTIGPVCARRCQR